MSGADHRRSARHLLGTAAEVQLGPKTFAAEVRDVSRHGMGLVLPEAHGAQVGEAIWLVVDAVASYAITGTVRRVAGTSVGIELDEILLGEALERIEAMPFAPGERPHAEPTAPDPGAFAPDFEP